MLPYEGRRKGRLWFRHLSSKMLFGLVYNNIKSARNESSSSCIQKFLTLTEVDCIWNHFIYRIILTGAKTPCISKFDNWTWAVYMTILSIVLPHHLWFKDTIMFSLLVWDNTLIKEKEKCIWSTYGELSTCLRISTFEGVWECDPLDVCSWMSSFVL